MNEMNFKIYESAGRKLRRDQLSSKLADIAVGLLFWSCFSYVVYLCIEAALP